MSSVVQLKPSIAQPIEPQGFTLAPSAISPRLLQLTFPRSCGPTRRLAEDAFQALRRALPDTDVYVQLAAG